MKKLVIISIITILLVLNTQTIFAEEITTIPTPEVVTEESNEPKTTIKAFIEDKEYEVYSLPELDKGTTVKIVGTTTPSIEINLRIMPINRLYESHSTVEGNFTFIILTENLDSGTYTAEISSIEGQKVENISEFQFKIKGGIFIEAPQEKAFDYKGFWDNNKRDILITIGSTVFIILNFFLIRFLFRKKFYSKIFIDKTVNEKVGEIEIHPDVDLSEQKPDLDNYKIKKNDKKKKPEPEEYKTRLV